MKETFCHIIIPLIKRKAGLFSSTCSKLIQSRDHTEIQAHTFQIPKVVLGCFEFHGMGWITTFPVTLPVSR